MTSLRTSPGAPTAAVDVVTGVLAAGSTILLAVLPSELFNSTLDENYAEIWGWFGLPPEPAQGGWWTAHPVPVFIAFVLAGGVMFGFLSPGFGLNLSSPALAPGWPSPWCSSRSSTTRRRWCTSGLATASGGA